MSTKLQRQRGGKIEKYITHIPVVSKLNSDLKFKLYGELIGCKRWK